MNPNTRARSGRRTALAASILVVAGIGLVGCQTGAVDQSLDESSSAAQRIARVNAASEARYEGLAEYWKQRAQRAETVVPVVADRIEHELATEQGDHAVPVVADRLERELATQPPTSTPVPVVADRLVPYE